MDAKVFSLIVMVLASLGIGSYIMSSSAVDTARTEFLEVQTLTTSTKTTMASRSKALEIKREEYEARQALDQHAADLAGQIEDLNKQIGDTKQQISQLKQRRFDAQTKMANLIQQVRAASVGLVVGPVPIKSGTAPADSKITKVEEGVLTLAHGQGMMKIPAEQLDASLMDRLRLNRPEAKEPSPLLGTSEE
jgi:TolA-binding protein